MEDTSSNDKKRTAVRIAPYAFALLCFLMPFFQVSCQGQKVAEVTGLNLVTGKDFGTTKDPWTGKTKVDRLEAKPLAIASAVAILIAGGLALIATRKGLLISAAGGVVSFILLVATRVQFADELAKGSQGNASLESLFGYYLACAGVLGGVFVVFYQIPQFNKPATVKPPESASP